MLGTFVIVWFYSRMAQIEALGMKICDKNKFYKFLYCFFVMSGGKIGKLEYSRNLQSHLLEGALRALFELIFRDIDTGVSPGSRLLRLP